MRVLAVIGATGLLLAGAAPSAAQEMTKARQTAAIAYLGDLAALAYAYGVCARHFPDNVPDDVIRALSAGDEGRSDAMQAMLKTIWAERLAVGRQEAPSKNWDRDPCMVMVANIAATADEKRRVLDEIR